MCRVVLSSFVCLCSCVSSAVATYTSELRQQLHIQMFITEIGLAPTFQKAYSDGHRHHTPSYLLKLYKRVTCPRALKHDDELDVSRAHNTFDRYQSQGRLGNEMRKFLLMCDLSSCKLHTSKVRFDSDNIVCLFLHNTVDGGELNSLHLYYCKHMSSKDQRSIACSEMDASQNCSLHHNDHISSALQKTHKQSWDPPLVVHAHEVGYKSC